MTTPTAQHEPTVTLPVHQVEILVEYAANYSYDEDSGSTCLSCGWNSKKDRGPGGMMTHFRGCLLSEALEATRRALAS